MNNSGFTLIETLVAISLLIVAIVAPMALATQSLSTAFYARDQVVAFHLAQEAIESVRAVRDHNILENAYGIPTDILTGLPSTDGGAFTIDTRDNTMALCPDFGGCDPLRNNGEFYGYGSGDGWEDTRFTRSVRANFVTGSDEVRIEVEVAWRTGVFREQSITISQNLYRWINDGSASQ